MLEGTMDVVAVPAEGGGGGAVQEEAGGAVFGVPLHEVMARPGERRIPSALKKLFLFLNGDAIEVQGLFRVAADSEEVSTIRRACDTGDIGRLLDQGQASAIKAHAVAGAVKEYLRMLPEPLLTWSLYSSFVDAASLSDSAGSSGLRRETVAGLIKRLPTHNRALAQVLFLYLARLADHSARNHMNSTNLAILFGPLLLRPNPNHESIESMLHGPRITLITKYIIDSYDLLFSKENTKEVTEVGHEAHTDGSSAQNPLGAFEAPKTAYIATDKIPERFQQIVEAIDESIALVQSKLLALHKQLEATDSMEEAIQIAKKIRTAKRILFHDDRKPKSGEGATDQDAQKQSTDGIIQTDKGDGSKAGENEGSSALASEDTSASPTQSVDGGKTGDSSLELRVESGYESLQGIRKTMEDAHVLLDDLLSSYPQLSSNAHISAPYAFYGVYDGHSGTEAAIAAAEVVHGEIINAVTFCEGKIEDSLREGFRKADAVILDRSAREGWKNGTTAVIAFILARHIYVANAGDSEAIMAQKQPDGSHKSVVLSHKHKPTDKDEKERIRAAGGHVVFGRLFGDLAVSRSLGDPDYKKPLSEANYISSEPHVSATPLTENDEFVILACDGVWDVLSYQEALDLIAAARKSGQTPTSAAQGLTKRALDKGSKDNVTAVVIYLHWRT